MAAPIGQQIVNARLLTELAVSFNIGADIFGKGNRKVESKLGASDESGSVVMVDIYDGGKVYDDLDLSKPGVDLSVKRDVVPLRVTPLCTGATLTQEDLTLAIKQPEFLVKRMAKLALEAQHRAVRCLEANALNATVIDTANSDELKRNKIYDMMALCDASKLDGNTEGLMHPLVYSKLIALFQNTYGPNNGIGGSLYEGELKNLAGLNWSKSNDLKRILAVATIGGDTAVSFDFSTALAYYYNANSESQNIEGPMNVPGIIPYAVVTGLTAADYFPATGNKVGDLSQPFKLKDSNNEYVCSTDALGNSTGLPAVFYLRATAVTAGAVTGAVLASPVFFEGPRQNVFHSTYTEYDGANGTGGTITGLTAEALLTANNSYLAPATVWKHDDFLVAAKGLEAYIGSDSLTIPTRYREKGYLPFRGWAWTDPLKSQTLFRVDVLCGCGAYTRTSINNLYVQA